ncbi:serine/threonine-protein kinase [Nocardia thailandica]|uniref:serine/threonine-protein kinase n=1 Tax=Nocardia thailandica TaxID=257275 RepID=UPI0005BE8FC9|nr:serine/threonine-protein kinase [Nocardia thailandica]
MEGLGPSDPRRIGHYRLLGVLGAGGMGRVYLGRTAGGRAVAIKVIRPELADEEFRRRFRREVAAARRVRGEYTAPVLDADPEAAVPWLATGYIAGVPLGEAIAGYGPLGEPALLRLATGLAAALSGIHAAGVVHRDLKPANVILGIGGPRVIDFGIARSIDDTALTVTGGVLGTPAFMSPEQVSGEAVGPGSDVFALAGILVHAATGRAPYGRGDVAQVAFRIVYEPLDLAGVPEPLRPILAACAAKDPEQRPRAVDLSARLRALCGREQAAGGLPVPLLEEISRRTAAVLELDPVPETPEPMPSHQVPIRPGPPPAATTGHRTPVPSGEVAGARWRSWRTVLATAAAAGVVVAAVVAGAFYGRDAPSAADRSSSTPPGPATVPAGLIGRWTGTARDPLLAYAVTVDIRAGTVGDDVATAVNTDTLTSTRCERTEQMTGAGASEIRLVARLSGGSSSCLDNGSTSTITLVPDGTAVYATTAALGRISGVLTKS